MAREDLFAALEELTSSLAGDAADGDAPPAGTEVEAASDERIARRELLDELRGL